MVTMSTDSDTDCKEEEEDEGNDRDANAISAHKTVESMYQRVYGKALLDFDAK
jgi:hypothetical protein